MCNHCPIGSTGRAQTAKGHVSTMSDTTSWRIDPAHTDIAFSAKHMMVTTVRGKFDQVEGELRLDETDPTVASGEIRIAAASLSTGFDARDQHLRSADFFDAEAHPWIVARVTDGRAARRRLPGHRRRHDPGRHPAGDVRRRVQRDRPRDARWPACRVPSERPRSTARRGACSWNVALEAGSWLVGKEIKLDIDIAADEAAAPSRESPVRARPTPSEPLP